MVAGALAAIILMSCSGCNLVRKSHDSEIVTVSNDDEKALSAKDIAKQLRERFFSTGHLFSEVNDVGDYVSVSYIADAVDSNLIERFDDDFINKVINASLQRQDGFESALNGDKSKLKDLFSYYKDDGDVFIFLFNDDNKDYSLTLSTGNDKSNDGRKFGDRVIADIYSSNYSYKHDQSIVNYTRDKETRIDLSERQVLNSPYDTSDYYTEDTTIILENEDRYVKNKKGKYVLSNDSRSRLSICHGVDQYDVSIDDKELVSLLSSELVRACSEEFAVDSFLDRNKDKLTELYNNKEFSKNYDNFKNYKRVLNKIK